MHRAFSLGLVTTPANQCVKTLATTINTLRIDEPVIIAKIGKIASPIKRLNFRLIIE